MAGRQTNERPVNPSYYKGPRATVLSFAGHKVSAATTQFCYWRAKTTKKAINCDDSEISMKQDLSSVFNLFKIFTVFKNPLRIYLKDSATFNLESHDIIISKGSLTIKCTSEKNMIYLIMYSFSK